MKRKAEATIFYICPKYYTDIFYSGNKELMLLFLSTYPPEEYVYDNLIVENMLPEIVELLLNRGFENVHSMLSLLTYIGQSS